MVLDPGVFPIMLLVRRFLQTLALLALGSLVPRAHAVPLASGTFTADNSFLSYSFNSTLTQTYTFTTTSFSGGGFVPVLTLFRTSGGVPVAFAETDNSDVTLSQLLGPGSYILYLTESPNVFTSTLAAGTLFASSPNATGDFCGVSGGKFLNVFDGCSQRTGNFAVSLTTTAATPEPGSLLLMLSPTAMLAISLRRRLAA